MTTSLPARLRTLLQPAAYPHRVRSVRVVETHISWVFLTGELAYKLKRPVHLPFVDLRSFERRAFFCAEELRLNRRFAPQLYQRVSPVTVEDGGARIEGRGEVIDHAVCMRQFPAADELNALLATAQIAPEELAAFGRELARLHEALPRPADEETWGRPEAVRALLMRNLQECLEAAQKLDTAEVIRSLREAFAARIAASEPWIVSRRMAGWVRECHGDLHIGNVARFGGRLVAFDCIEFEPAFRWIDVAEEIACLYMDLCARRFDAHAQAFLDGYLRETGDYSACRMLRLYGVHRALVRAKVAALRAAQVTEPETHAGSGSEHRRYLECAAQLLAPPRPRLILMCGLSGSGKSWLAQRLASKLGAIHLRSDVERKRLGGLAAGQRSGAALGQGLYSAAKSAATYERLRECAGEALAGQLSVIIDATCQRQEQRARLASLGASHGAGVYVIFCHAPREVLEARIAAREREARDASEADRRVLALQERSFEPLGAAERLAVIDADTAQADVISQVLQRLE
jgi:uncharacterized protein